MCFLWLFISYSEHNKTNKEKKDSLCDELRFDGDNIYFCKN